MFLIVLIILMFLFGVDCLERLIVLIFFGVDCFDFLVLIFLNSIVLIVLMVLS